MLFLIVASSGQHFKLSLSILSKGCKHRPSTLGGNERCLENSFVHVCVSTYHHPLPPLYARLCACLCFDFVQDPLPPPYATRRRIYDIGTEILNFHCFATNMLKPFCKSFLVSGTCSIFCGLYFCSSKTWFKALWICSFEKLHATLDSQVPHLLGLFAPGGRVRKLTR